MTKLNIVATHGYSDSNKGDLAITYSTLQEIKQNFPKSKITVLSTFDESDPEFDFHHRFLSTLDIKIIEGILPSPYIISRSHSITRNLIAFGRLVLKVTQVYVSLGLPRLGRWFAGRQHRAVNALKAADIVIVKGGQFLYNDQGGIRGKLFLWRTLFPINLANKLKKKVYLCGHSIGPLTPSAMPSASRCLNNCQHIFVREELSLSLLKKHLTNDNVSLAPDFAFLTKPKKFDLPNYVDTSKPIIGITVVNWSFPESDNPARSRNAYKKALIQTVKSLNTSNYSVMFIPQVTVTHHGSSDLDLIDEITSDLNQDRIAFTIFQEDIGCEEMAYLYQCCHLLIGTRLHSCILAACAGTPCIAIHYQGFKTRGVMAALGLHDYIFDIYNMKSDDLLNAINKMSEERSRISNSLTRISAEFHTKLAKIIRSMIIASNTYPNR